MFSPIEPQRLIDLRPTILSETLDTDDVPIFSVKESSNSQTLFLQLPPEDAPDRSRQISKFQESYHDTILSLLKRNDEA